MTRQTQLSIELPADLPVTALAGLNKALADLATRTGCRLSINGSRYRLQRAYLAPTSRPSDARSVDIFL